MGVHLLLLSETFSNYAYLLTVLLSLKLLPRLLSIWLLENISINMVLGLALAINEVLYSRNILSQMLDIATPAKPTKPITSIPVRTAQRLFAKCGWIYSGNKKRYIDGHERDDIVQYLYTKVSQYFLFAA